MSMLDGFFNADWNSCKAGILFAKFYEICHFFLGIYCGLFDFRSSGCINDLFGVADLFERDGLALSI